MRKKELRSMAKQIKKTNFAVREAIFALGDFLKVREKINGENPESNEVLIRELAILLKDFHDEEGFEDPCGYYGSYFQDFQETMRQIEEAMEESEKAQ